MSDLHLLFIASIQATEKSLITLLFSTFYFANETRNLQTALSCHLYHICVLYKEYTNDSNPSNIIGIANIMAKNPHQKKASQLHNDGIATTSTTYHK